MQADGFDGTAANSGTAALIWAFARARASAEAPSAAAMAVGISFADHGSTHDAASGLLVNNSGSIWAGYSLDGDGAILRGTAISTRGTKSVLHQQWMGSSGEGSIFGDVNIDPEDSIEIGDGVTRFNGVVNADGMLRGSMTILGGSEPGTLFLVLEDPVAGPQPAPQVNVDSFEQQAGATLKVQLAAPDPGDTTEQAGPDGGSFLGQIRGREVMLDGDLVVERIDTLPFPDEVIYEDLVVATELGTGQWANVISVSPLIDFEALYEEDWGEGAGTVDLRVVNVSFEAVEPRTQNQRAANDDIARTFPDADTGSPEYQDLLTELFALGPDPYLDALSQLAGPTHPQTLWALTRSLDLFRRSENARMKLSTPDASGRAGGAWVSAQGSWGDVDGDEEAPGFDLNRRAVHVGADIPVAPGATVGAGIGYYDAALDFDAQSARAEFDGIQFGLYGMFEQGPWYGNLFAGYGHYDGDTARSVELGSLMSRNRGSFDAQAYLLSAEVGRRLDFAGGWIAPFGGVTYQRGEIDSFAEKAAGDAAGSALRVSGEADSIVSDIGARFGLAMPLAGGATLSLEGRLSWQHEFGDAPAEMEASFVGMPGSKFEVIGSDVARDSAAVDVGLSVRMGGIEFRAGYNGRLGTDARDHAVFGQIAVRF